jgi:hypothetical protein
VIELTGFRDFDALLEQEKEALKIKITKKMKTAGFIGRF